MHQTHALVFLEHNDTLTVNKINYLDIIQLSTMQEILGRAASINNIMV